MIPVYILIIYFQLWMFPIAIVTGNTYVMKPSERVPGAVTYLTKLLEESGVPKGVVNIV